MNDGLWMINDEWWINEWFIPDDTGLMIDEGRWTIDDDDGFKVTWHLPVELTSWFLHAKDNFTTIVNGL